MGSRVERHQHNNNHHQNLVPLAALISREMRSEKMEKPTVRYGSAAQSRKGEDYFLMKTDCLRVTGNPSSSFSVFGVCFCNLSVSSMILVFIILKLSLDRVLNDLYYYLNQLCAHKFKKMSNASKQ